MTRRLKTTREILAWTFVIWCLTGWFSFFLMILAGNRPAISMIFFYILISWGISFIALVSWWSSDD